MKRNLPVALLLALLTMALFWPATQHDFVNFDDPDYVTANPEVQKGLSADTVIWAFKTGHAANWHPLTWLSHMLDVQLFGMRPAGHHFTSVLLHIANTVLLFGFLLSVTGARWRSLAVAALFALHPLHVESVAWIAERKDVLSGLFFLLTLWAYATYAKAGHASNSTHRSPKRYYALALVCFALGLMSKPMLVTLPFLLLLLDFWPLGRLRLPGKLSAISGEAASSSPQPVSLAFLLLEKLPFFLLTVLSSLITFIVQREGGAMQSLVNMSFSTRLENALVSYMRYLGKTLWPAGLATPYTHPGDWPWVTVASAVALLLGLSLAVLWLARRWPYLPVAWFWYVGMLVPVIGLVQVGAQSMADRYTYLPLIGVFIAMVWLGADAVSRGWLPRVAAGSLLVAVLAGCIGRTFVQLRSWRDTVTLFRNAIAADPGNWIAHYNLGHYLDDKGDKAQALTNYFQAVAIQPRAGEAWNNIGFVFAEDKQYAAAIPHFRRALEADAGSVDASRNLAKALEQIGQLDEAVERYKFVLQRRPKDVQTMNALANTLARKGRFDEAVTLYEASLGITPDQPVVHYGLANALTKLRRAEEALAHYRRAVQLRQDYAEAHNDLGIALARKGDLQQAAEHFRLTVQLQTNNIPARCNLGRSLAGLQKLDEAIAVFREALRIAPETPDAHSQLGLALAIQGNLAEAVSHFNEALRLRPEDPFTHFNLGKALANQGNREAAARHYQETLRLRPDYAPARKELESLSR